MSTRVEKENKERYNGAKESDMKTPAKQSVPGLSWQGPVWRGAVLLLLTCVPGMADWQYDAGTPITAVSITNPTPNEVWLIGTPHVLTCTTSTDTDRRRQCETDPWEPVDDSVTHFWDGTGTFQDNDNVGTSVTYICTDSSGNNTVTVYADDNFVHEPQDSAIVDEGPATDSETVSVVGLEVYQVGFGNDHALYRTPTGAGSRNGWADGTTAIADPVYNADDTAAEIAAKNHACFTRGVTNATLTSVRCRATAALTEGSSFQLGALGTNTWAWAAFAIATNSRESGTGSLSLYNNALANTVKKYDGSYNCAWKYRCPTGSNTQLDLNTTSHSVYLTYATPSPSGVSRTVQRISYVCGSADGETTVDGAAGKIYATLRALNLQYVGGALRNGPVPIWLIHDGEQSQCPGLAMFVKAHFDMVGLTGGQIRYCWAKADGTCTYDLVGVTHNQTRTFPVAGHSNPTPHDDNLTYEKLRMLDGSSVVNNYEATCYLNGTYYFLVGSANDGRKTSPSGVVTFCFNVNWYYWTGAAWALCSEVRW